MGAMDGRHARMSEPLQIVDLVSQLRTFHDPRIEWGAVTIAHAAELIRIAANALEAQAREIDHMREAAVPTVAELSRLRAALRRYGRHLDSCCLGTTLHKGGCTCGFSAALAGEKS